MSEEDRKYLRHIKKMGPSLEIFEGMVQILKDIQEKTDKLLRATSPMKLPEASGI